MADDMAELTPPARGCPFQNRCPVKCGPVCDTDTPPLRDAGDGHLIRCHIPLDDLRALKATGVISGAISGRALYDGAIDLAQALKVLARD
jgi:hypothetical protein